MWDKKLIILCYCNTTKSPYFNERQFKKKFNMGRGCYVNHHVTMRGI